MLGCIVLNVLDKLGRVDNFDVIGEADDEAANAAIIGDEGIKEPVGIVHLKDLVLSKGVLLDEQAVSHHAQAKLNTMTVVAGHAEYIDEATAMRVAMFP